MRLHVEEVLNLVGKGGWSLNGGRLLRSTQSSGTPLPIKSLTIDGEFLSLETDQRTFKVSNLNIKINEKSWKIIIYGIELQRQSQKGGKRIMVPVIVEMLRLEHEELKKEALAASKALQEAHNEPYRRAARERQLTAERLKAEAEWRERLAASNDITAELHGKTFSHMNPDGTIVFTDGTTFTPSTPS